MKALGSIGLGGPSRRGGGDGLGPFKKDQMRCVPCNVPCRLAGLRRLWGPARPVSATAEPVADRLAAVEEQARRPEARALEPNSAGADGVAPLPHEGIAGEREREPLEAPGREGQAAFDWHSCWYPVAVASQLDPSRPHKAMLLGIHLVLWRDGAGRWAAAEDACPHRMAQLSDGLLRRGALTCRYHAWAFDSEGRCLDIPQATSDRACADSRACLKSVSVREEQGLVWVWPAGGAGGAAAAAAASPPLFPENADPGWLMGGDYSEWIFQDFPLSFDVAAENPLDPSHAPYLHARSLSLAAPTPMAFTMKEPVGPGGFTVGHGGYMESNKGLVATRAFTPPGTLRTLYKYPDGKQYHYTNYTTPVAPGRTGSFFKLVVKDPPLPFTLLFNGVPRWLRIAGGDSADEDRVVLAGQDAAFDRCGRDRGRYLLNTSADMGVSAFYRWFSDYGGGRVPYRDDGQRPVPELSRAHLLDRYACFISGREDGKRGIAISTAAAAACAAVAGAAVVTAIAAVANTYLLGVPAPAGALRAAAAAAAVATFLGVGFYQLRQSYFGYEDLLEERLARQSPLARLPMAVVNSALLLGFMAAYALRLLLTWPLRALGRGAGGTGAAAAEKGAPAADAATSAVPSSAGRDEVAQLLGPLRTAAVGSHRIAYRRISGGTAGGGTTVPLFLLPGYGQTMSEWTPELLRALSQGREVVVFDNPWEGLSQPEAGGEESDAPITVPQLVDFTLGLFDALGLAAPDVAGWSLGGLVALRLAALHPTRVRRVACWSAVIDGEQSLPPGHAAALQGGADRADAPLPPLFRPGCTTEDRAGLFFPPTAEGRAGAARWLAGVAQMPPDPASPAASPRYVAGIFESVGASDNATWEALPTCGVPVMWVAGEEDSLVPVGNMAAVADRARRGRLETVPGAGHCFWGQCPDRTAALMDDFLN